MSPATPRRYPRPGREGPPVPKPLPRTDRRTKGGRAAPSATGPAPRGPAMEGDAPCVTAIEAASFSRTSSHRKAMFSNMAAALLEHEQIVTTLPIGGRTCRPQVEKLITLGK